MRYNRDSQGDMARARGPGAGQIEMEAKEMEIAKVIDLMSLYCDGAYSDYKRLQKEKGEFDIATSAAFYKWMGAIEMAREMCEQLYGI